MPFSEKKPTIHSTETKEISVYVISSTFFPITDFCITKKGFFEGSFQHFKSHKEKKKTTLQLCCHIEKISILQFRILSAGIWLITLFCNMSFLLILRTAQNVRV